MIKQGNVFQIKKKINSPNEVELYSLPEKEFKITIMKMLPENDTWAK